jgi:hypothetical protein
MENTIPMYVAFARTIAWRASSAYLDARIDRLYTLAGLLPKGGGIDCGPYIHPDISRPNRIELSLEFHHMDEFGVYDRWTHHSITVLPSLCYGFELRFAGPNHNDVVDLLRDQFDAALRQHVKLSFDGHFYSLAKELTPC